MNGQHYYIGQKFIISGKKVEIKNFIFCGDSPADVELIVDGSGYTVDYDYFSNAKKVEVFKF